MTPNSCWVYIVIPKILRVDLVGVIVINLEYVLLKEIIIIIAYNDIVWIENF